MVPASAVIAQTQSAPVPLVSVRPNMVVQGEPIMVSVEGVNSVMLGAAAVRSIMFNGKSLGMFLYEGKPSALYGIDIRARVGTSTVTVSFADGTSVQRAVHVGERKRVEEAFGIPDRLGGNTATSAATLVSTLARENASLLGLRTGPHAFWTGPFGYPIMDPVVTDPYGYSRDTMGYPITHKGTDFRAVEGTPVLAMNRGVVRLVREGRNYGKTVVIDHGLGVQTFYMHLSKIGVTVGDLVLPGQIIGLSGMTGYAEAAHLHATVRIGEVSIDPVKFLELFK